MNVRLYVCMYVCMYVYMYVRMYVCIYVCMYVCTYVRMYIHMYVCMYVHMYVCMYVCIYVCICTYYLLLVASHEKCPRGFMDLNTITAKAPLGFEGFPSTVDELGSEIRIIPEMKFTCSGEITKIVVGARVRPKRDDHDGCYPQLQIWREADNKKDQIVFNLVSSHEIVLTEDDFNPSGYFKYYFSPHVPFQAGDAIGIYQPSDTSDVQLYYTTLFNTGPTTYTLDIPNGLPYRSTFDLNGQGVTPVEGQRLLLRPKTSMCVCNTNHVCATYTTDLLYISLFVCAFVCVCTYVCVHAYAYVVCDIIFVCERVCILWT